MRRFVFALVSFAFVLLADIGVGQESSVPVTQVIPEKSPALLPADVAELEIALGRLRLVPDRFRIVRKHEQWSVPGGGAGQRSYQLSAADGRPALRVNYSDPQEKWNLHIDSLVGAQWSRQYRCENQEVHIDYCQKPFQAIEIKVTVAANKPVNLQGTTLWHLTEQGSSEFTKYVLPSLSRLNATWDLPKALASAKRMRDQSGLAAKLSEHQLAQYLADLDSGDHRVREQAKLKMQQAGLAAQIPLERLRQGRLSPQQLSTVNELLADLEPRSADTPTRLAYWLSGDPSWR